MIKFFMKKWKLFSVFQRRSEFEKVTALPTIDPSYTFRGTFFSSFANSASLVYREYRSNMFVAQVNPSKCVKVLFRLMKDV